MRVFAILAAVFILAIAPLSGAAAADLTKEDIARILMEEGHNVRDFDSNKVAVNVEDHIVIVGVVNGDITYLAYLSGVSSDQVGYKLLNEFNNKIKFARAYVDSDGDVAIQMDRNSEGGVTAENIRSDFEVFLRLIWTFLNDLEMQRIS